ncbi:RICIN domain-containing protein [Nonomuraea sp. NPDC048892]|uniref:RICIN domain-containing protein n=1 Tax=Nonomuraea sp. NPDC048892 TaxID=3154624 RepID=UPI0033D3A540
MTDIESEKVYRIRNAKSGTYIDITEDGGTVHAVGNPLNDSDTQMWQLNRIGPGWTLRNVGTGTYLSTNLEPRNDDGALLQESPFEWLVWEDDAVTQSCRLCVPHCKKDLEVTNHGSSGPGTRIAVWGRWAGQSQMWFFEECKS